MKAKDIEFEEIKILLDRPETRGKVLKYSPTGKVPCLIDDAKGITVWDSLAIIQYLAEAYPDKGIWPEDEKAKAMAFSYAAEMHSGFPTLRNVWPMCFTRTGLRLTRPIGDHDGDVKRVLSLWQEAREAYVGKGDFLFGDFSAADAMFAPVVSRFKTYGPLTDEAYQTNEIQTYMEIMWNHNFMQEWGRGAAEEVTKGEV